MDKEPEPETEGVFASPQLRQEDPKPSHTIEDIVDEKLGKVVVYGIAVHEITQFLFSYDQYQQEWELKEYYDSGFTIAKSAVALALGFEQILINLGWLPEIPEVPAAEE